MINFDQAMVSSTTALLQDGDVIQALRSLLQITSSFYGGSTCFLLENQVETNEFNNICQYTPEGEVVKITTLPRDSFSHMEESFAKDEVVTQPAFHNDCPHCFYAPIREEGSLLAVLVLENPQKSEIDWRLLQSMMLFFQGALQKRKLMQEVESIYDRDLLTGFYNYQRYLAKLDKLLANPPKKLGVVFVDMDSKLKKLNPFALAPGEDDIIQGANLVETFFKQPFYRVAETQFLCFASNIPRETFVSQVNSLRMDQSARGFSVAYSWKSGEEAVLHQVKEINAFMEEEMEQGEISDISVQKDLLNAIQSKEFEIYFQPKVELKTKRVVGAEALVRRKTTREDSSLLYPAIFVQLYEDQAIIRHLDLYVVDFVCKTLAEWMEQGIEIPISVNFSRVTLTEYGIVDTISDICEKYGVPHRLLVIEFTERIAMMNDRAYEHLAEEFERRGFRLSLDDFGVAYSNLITLAKIDIGEIKIDKVLIHQMEENEKNQIILRSIIEMCLSLETTASLAEGIENEAQVEKLLEFGCVYGQGNYFSPPVDAEEFYCEFLQKEKKV
ncbi:MAG: bifunctional diguanylate cyclase/phosphodiesterase [Eubacteriales bacterium]